MASPIFIRIGIGLPKSDHDGMVKLRAELELKMKKKLSLADVVRMALTELAAKHKS